MRSEANLWCLNRRWWLTSFIVEANAMGSSLCRMRHVLPSRLDAGDAVLPYEQRRRRPQFFLGCNYFLVN